MTARKPPRLLVFGDSLSFHGPAGPCAADEPRLWGNVAAAALGGNADLVAGFGWTARDLWWSLIGDPRVWADLRDVDAVVLAVGSMDPLPSPLPTYLRTGLRYLRPPWLRRAARKAYLAAQPRLVVALRGRPVALPKKLTVHYLGKSVYALRVLRPDLPIVAILPSVHRAPSYRSVYPGRDATAAAIAGWAGQAGVPLLDLSAVVGEHVLGGRGNPDGMHWGWEGHTAVGKAMAALIGPLLDKSG
ncbi:MAG TPA: diglucosylglycerate octanoyltransferase [Amycolatopsis sp.]|uniref:diglucosylglycerate octanoyltransferase n=1 Tax=Amycolatopsis sp. TaxID=37632 RepID=UPI002B492248|nr:diglucosylglycerate octanoyltransferase [Amycolatopsis sp.]HKS45961.1 diglucosylglycerate octanoyltransferase [Amycolatopsis sp.]